MKIGILIGSIRQGRVSDREAKWIDLQLKKKEGIETVIIDLLDYPMPHFDEAKSPQFNPDRKTEGVIAKYLQVMGEIDSLVVITPEYNRSYSSILKNALDYIDFQLKNKPVMLASHGSTGGAQAVSHLRAVFPGLLAVTSPVALMITSYLSESFDENCNLITSSPSAEHIQMATDRALEEFIWFSRALSEARAKDTSS